MSEGNIVITDPRVEHYVLDIAALGQDAGIASETREVLSVMEQTAVRLNYPIMGPLIGRTLYLLAGVAGARRIFDAGSGMGYSATWLACGAGSGAEIVTLDTNEEHQARAKEFHRRAGLGARFDYQVGDAVDILQEAAGPFDLVYNDVNKGSYPRMAQLAIERLRPGGLYIADNALWYGKVCSASTTRDAWTAAVDQHNQWIFSQEGLFATILDQREGLLIAVKRSQV